MSSKTPVSLLQELCMKKGQGHPFYDLFEDGNNEDKQFAYTVDAFGQRATGKAKSKKEARHDAAANIITILKQLDDLKDELSGIADISMPRAPTGGDNRVDAIGTLLDICVQRDWPLATFTVQQAFGAPHAPDFVVECRIASMARLGTFSTKKGAKQIAAQKMLDIIQNLPADETQLQLATIIDDESNESIVKTYRELKNSDVKSQPGILLCDRHKYFQNLDDQKKETIRNIIYTVNDTACEKISLICKAMKWKYEVSRITEHPIPNYYLFELFCPNYDVALSGTDSELYNEIINYFKVMIGV